MPTGSKMLTTKCVANSIEVSGEEAGMLENAEHEKIAGDADRERGKAPARGWFCGDQEMADEIVEHDRRQQQRHGASC